MMARDQARDLPVVGRFPLVFGPGREFPHFLPFFIFSFSDFVYSDVGSWNLLERRRGEKEQAVLAERGNWCEKFQWSGVSLGGIDGRWQTTKALIYNRQVGP